MEMTTKLTLIMLVLALCEPVLASERPLSVDCDKGQSLNRAQMLARPGQTIRVRGHCQEQVTIIKDRLTIDGQGTAVVDAGSTDTSDETREGAITIDGARGVTITGFTVQNGADGISCRRSAACIVRDTLSRQNADDGFGVNENATLILIDSTAQSNGNNGINVDTGSSVLFGGTVVSENNTDNGLTVVGSHVDIGGAILQLINNQRGLIVLNSGSVILLSGEQSVLQVEDNALDGILLTGGGQIFLSGGTVAVNNNGQDGLSLIGAGGIQATGGAFEAIGNARVGINLISASTLTNIGAAFLVQDSVVGINVEAVSAILNSPPGSMVVHNNTTDGLAAAGNSSLTMIGADITGNTPDVSLSLGTTANLTASKVGSIVCDETVIGIAAPTCPANR